MQNLQIQNCPNWYTKAQANKCITDARNAKKSSLRKSCLSSTSQTHQSTNLPTYKTASLRTSKSFQFSMKAPYEQIERNRHSYQPAKAQASRCHTIGRRLMLMAWAGSTTARNLDKDAVTSPPSDKRCCALAAPRRPMQMGATTAIF